MSFKVNVIIEKDESTRPLSDILLGGFRTWSVLNIEKVLQIDREALDVKN
jgi:hypothetical protein